MMESDTSYNSSEYMQYENNNNNNSNSGLLRFSSAPSSFCVNLNDGVEKGGSKSQGLSSRFSSGSSKCSNIASQSSGILQVEKLNLNINSYGMISQLPPQYPRQVGCIDSGFGIVGSSGKVGCSLARQNSSPAGLFSHLTSQNDYAALRGGDSYKVLNGSRGEFSPSSSRLKSHMNFSSARPSSLGMLSLISEAENENCGVSGAADEEPRNTDEEAKFYSSGFSFGSWNDSPKLEETFYGHKREVDNDVKSFAKSQSAEHRDHPPILSHHLSLPKSSAETAAMEKLMHFPDAVPCKIRAKRGFATHPRSIAERVRRTKISERMRKLQDLVPNMDKQTNTSDMLDLAVKYIKDLQQQYKKVADIRANCKCSALQKPSPDQTS